MSKIVAIAFSDIHIHNFRAFNDGNYNRLQESLRALYEIGKFAIKKNVPLLFTGDLIHAPKEIENPTMTGLLVVLKKLFKHKNFRLIAISGNHDFFTRNTPHESSPSYLDGLSKVFKRFYHLNNSWYYGPEEKRVCVYGIPYYDNDKHTQEAIRKVNPDDRHFNILMLHSDFPGAKTPEGTKVGEVEQISAKMLKRWDLVIMGHIHMPQRLAKNVWMLGPPIHQDRSSIGQRFGFWVIYDNGEMVFRCLNDEFPCFIPEGKKAKEIDYIVPKEEDAQLTEQEAEDKTFHVAASSDKLTKRYLRKKGIKSKKKRRALIKILNEVR